MIDQFTTWFEKIKPDMEHVYKILQDKLSDEPQEMISQAQDAEAWKSRMTYLLAEATTWLDRANQFYIPTGENKKELEKRVELKARTADIREIKEKIEGLVDTIDSRISFVQSNLKYESQKSEPREYERKPY